MSQDDLQAERSKARQMDQSAIRDQTRNRNTRRVQVAGPSKYSEPTIVGNPMTHRLLQRRTCRLSAHLDRQRTSEPVGSDA